MTDSNLIFNLLTFDFSFGDRTMYFSKKDIGRCQVIHRSIFPEKIDSLFPGIKTNGTEKIYTTFTCPYEEFKPLSIRFETENSDFIKRYYNRQINHYFNDIGQIVKVGFIKENQVWVHSSNESNEQSDIYEKYSLKVQLKTVSDYPELLLSYDGRSKVLKRSAATLIREVSPTCFNWILSNGKLRKWEWMSEEEMPDYEQCFPVLNKKLQAALHIPVEPPDRDNRYPRYWEKINHFYNQFLNNDEFRNIIPLHDPGFLKVNPSRINKTSDESNQLLFGNGVGAVPKYGIRDLEPYKGSPYNNIHLFFILHKDDREHALRIKTYLEEGFHWFKGLYKYAHILFHTEQGFSIVFSNKDNPVQEIEEKLSNRVISPDVKYIAIYLTPYSKFEHDRHKREIYYKVKELLLKRRITSQFIDPAKLDEQGSNWVYSLPNIAVAILAKLDGIPWRLNTPVKNELIVGVGAFKQIEEGIQYIGSAFSFANNGKFNSFEYFMRDEVDILAGKIANAVRNYTVINNPPDRLIIHFYKCMSEKELKYIEDALHNLKVSMPVFIISINKTESEDIVAFDTGWKELMPLSGTFINIGNGKYLLFNNTRYSDDPISKSDGYPFPIKLAIDCTEKEQLNDARVIRELIDQAYQFSRMYWKSVRQQNLPVTIKYPEMVAQIAPHFDSGDIPSFGKSNLWFL
ncbi:MAG: Piwi domain-containing protein [Mangrovibacterium sp.]|nr:Piwi domain-containing protein [Mangrovibacterium sp.]